MAQDNKLLLMDLCARLPYGVKVHVINDTFYDVREPYDTNINYSNFHLFTSNKLIVKPYLRSMSSMTEEERTEYFNIIKNTIEFYNCQKSEDICFLIVPIDWLNSHHLDYRGLIEKGLALEASEGMYK